MDLVVPGDETAESRISMQGIVPAQETVEVHLLAVVLLAVPRDKIFHRITGFDSIWFSLELGNGVAGLRSFLVQQCIVPAVLTAAHSDLRSHFVFLLKDLACVSMDKLTELIFDPALENVVTILVDIYEFLVRHIAQLFIHVAVVLRLVPHGHDVVALAKAVGVGDDIELHVRVIAGVVDVATARDIILVKVGQPTSVVLAGHENLGGPIAIDFEVDLVVHRVVGRTADDIAARIAITECPVVETDLHLAAVRRRSDVLRSAEELVRAAQVFEHKWRRWVVFRTGRVTRTVMPRQAAHATLLVLIQAVVVTIIDAGLHAQVGIPGQVPLADGIVEEPAEKSGAGQRCLS